MVTKRIVARLECEVSTPRVLSKSPQTEDDRQSLLFDLQVVTFRRGHNACGERNLILYAIWWNIGDHRSKSHANFNGLLVS